MIPSLTVRNAIKQITYNLVGPETILYGNTCKIYKNNTLTLLS